MEFSSSSVGVCAPSWLVDVALGSA